MKIQFIKFVCITNFAFAKYKLSPNTESQYKFL